jgi:O-antigen ligase
MALPHLAGMATPLNWIRLGLLVAIWLCPIWRDPTPVVPTLLWGGICLGLLLLLSSKTNQIDSNDRVNTQRPRSLHLLLLVVLAGMVAWRSTSSANALAAGVCIAAIGLSAHLSQLYIQHKLVHWIAYGWLLGGLINSALALAQYFGLTPEPVGTAFGFLRQRNQMATLCTTAIVALLYVIHTARWLRPIEQRLLPQRLLPQRFLALSAAAVLCAALAATCSRTGFLQLIVVCATALALACKTSIARRGQLALAACAFIACYALAAWALPQLSHHPETVMTRVLDAADTARIQINDSRRPLWDNTRALIEAQPLFGVGWRELAYNLHITDFGVSPRFHAQADHTHNIVLQFAVELGLPFTMLWFLLLLYGVISLKPWRVRAPAALLGWGVLTMIAIHSLLEYPLWYAPFQIALGLALGLVIACQPTAPTSQAASAPRISSLAGMTRSATMKKIMAQVPSICGAGLLLFCIYAAFDYHRMSQLFLSTDKRADIYQANTMAKVEGSWLFANQVRFAKLLITPVTEANAKEIWTLGQQVIHFSPEPRVFKVLIAAGGFLEATDTLIAAELAVLKRQLALIER